MFFFLLLREVGAVMALFWYGCVVFLCRVVGVPYRCSVALALLRHRGGGGGALPATATALGNNGEHASTHLPKPPLTKTTGHLFFHASLVSGRSA